MKPLFVVLLVTGLIPAAFAAAEKGLVLYFDFEKGVGGDVAIDKSGAGNDGTIVKAKWVEGKFGSGLFFDGVTAYITVPDNDSLRFQNFTLSLWINIPKRFGSMPQVYPMMINKMLCCNFGYKLGCENPNPDDDKLVIAIAKAGVQSFPAGFYNSKKDIGLNEWRHIAGTWDGSVGKLYIDGVLKSEGAKEKREIGHDNTPLTIMVEPGFIVGANTHVLGTIDEVKIFSRALSGEEIERSMTAAAAVEPSGKLATGWGRIKSQRM